MKKLFFLILFFVVGLCGCETVNPLCTENYCVEGKIYGKSLLPENAEYGELPINDSQLLGAITGNPVAPIANFVEAHPRPNSQIAPNTVFTVIFDNPPSGVIVTTPEVEVEDNAGLLWNLYGNSLSISVANGLLLPGLLEFTITWANGTQKLHYFVDSPDTDPPIIVGSIVMDGDTDVDPEVINWNGIEIQFSENVGGNITLETQAGDNVGWLGRVEGNEARLEVVKGREIEYDTTYVIVGKVQDSSGNETSFSITFTTLKA